MRPAFLYDDAYITLASARAVWHGGDPHFPHAGVVDGITSPVHFSLVTVLVALLPAEWALLASCLIGAAAYAAGLWMLGHHENLSRLESAALVIAGCGAGMISQHLVNGLETSWALAGVTWLLVCARRGWAVGIGVCCGTLPFIRPELGILAVAVTAHRIHQARRIESPLVAGGVVAAIPWLALMLWTTGGLVPTSLMVKRDWYAETCWTWSRRAAVVGTGGGLWLRSNAFVSLGLIGLLRDRLGRFAVLAVVLTLFIWSLSVPDVLHAYQRHRYYAPFLPLLIAGLALLPLAVRQYAILLAALAAVVTTTAVVRLEPAAIARASDLRASVVRALRDSGSSRVLVHDIGYMPFDDAAPVFIDMVGLKDRRAARAHHELTGPTCGARRADALRAVALDERPDALVIWQPWDDYFGVSKALLEAGWRLRRLGAYGTTEPVVVYALHSPGK